MDRGLFGIGAVAERAGCSVSLISKLERSRVIPEAERIAGSNYRVWDADAVRVIEDEIKSRNERRTQTDLAKAG